MLPPAPNAIEVRIILFYFVERRCKNHHKKRKERCRIQPANAIGFIFLERGYPIL